MSLYFAKIMAISCMLAATLQGCGTCMLFGCGPCSSEQSDAALECISVQRETSTTHFMDAHDGNEEAKKAICGSINELFSCLKNDAKCCENGAPGDYKWIAEDKKETYSKDWCQGTLAITESC